MKIDFVVTDRNQGEYSEKTSATVEKLKAHIEASTYRDYYTPLYRNYQTGTQGADIVINFNGFNKALIKDAKLLARIIEVDTFENRNEEKSFTLSFRKCDMPLADQNKFVTEYAIFAHNALVGNPDYVESAIVVNYDIENNTEADFGETPHCTIIFGIEDCKKSNKAVFKKILGEITQKFTELL